MDIHYIGELHCAVCFELFGENFKCPRMLTCGHSFCHSCLENLLVQSPTCPNCKQEIQFSNAGCIPVNYIAKSLVSRFNVNSPDSNCSPDASFSVDLFRELKEESADSLPLKKECPSKDLPYEGFCDDHNNYKPLRCMDCKCWVCGVCVALHHKPCRTLLVAEALNEMKQKISIEVEAEIETRNFQNKNLDKLLQYLEEKRMSLKNDIKELQFGLRSKIESLKSLSKCIEKLQSTKSDRNKNCERLKHLETSVKETSNNDQLMQAEIKLNIFLTRAQKLVEELLIPRHFHCHLSKQLLRDWCQEGSVYSVRCQNGSSQFGKVVVKGDRVWVHCFHSQGPSRKDVIISFRDLLIAFSGFSELPRRGFLQIDDADTLDLNDVVIATDALTPRATNFLLLCSGIKGRSYEGGNFFREPKGRYISTTTPNGGGSAVVKGIKDGGVYDAPWKKGFVCGWQSKYADYLSGFGIFMKDSPTSKLSAKFGFVEEGIVVCERILSNENKIFAIKHCGLVI